MAKLTKTQREALGDLIEALMQARANVQCALDRRDLAGATDYGDALARWSKEESSLAWTLEHEYGVQLPWLREFRNETETWRTQ